MAKFCGNCGTKLDENTKVCGNCGTPVDIQTSNIQGLSKKKNKIIKFIPIFIAIVIVFSIAFNIVSNFTGNKGLLNKVMKAYENYDIETLVSLSSDVYYYAEENYVEDYFEYCVGNTLDSFESSIGHNFKLSYEVSEIYDFSRRNLEEEFSEIENTYVDFNVDKIKKIVGADVILTAEKDGNSSTKNIKIVMTKEDNKWKLLYIE